MNGFSIGNAELASALSAVAIMVAGLIAARLTQRVVGRSLSSLDGWLSRYSSSDSGWITPTSAAAISGASFWLVVLMAVVISLRMLGVGEFSDLIEGVADFVPRLLVAVVIVGIGHLLGLLARALVARMSDTMLPDSHIPRLVHGAVLVFALLIALQQLNVNITFVTQLILTLVVVFLGGLTLAFALGARTHVSNLLGRAELRRYAIGEQIRIDDIEGVIVHIHGTGVDVATQDGMVSIPASRFAEVAVLRIPETESES
jgi:hypothetical protein